MARVGQKLIRSFAVLVVGTILAASHAFAADCPGDCDGDGQVVVAEVIVAVRILLGETALTACPIADHDVDGKVSVGDVVRAVRASLDGCPTVCGDGVVDRGEACDVGDPEVQCYEGCTEICCAGFPDCAEKRCCSTDEVDQLVPFDPECRNCAPFGDTCGIAMSYEIVCCEGLRCGELRLVAGRALFGRCCRPTGSACETHEDCCGTSEIPLSLGDFCTDGFCRQR